MKKAPQKNFLQSSSNNQLNISKKLQTNHIKKRLKPLIQHDKFVNWDYLERDGKTIKPPVNNKMIPINAQSSANWRSFDEAIEISDKIGFVLTCDDPFLFIDLDHVLTNGNLCGWANSLLDELPTTYTEVSPSGDGIHLYYMLDDSPHIPSNKHAMKDKSSLEVYFNNRYFTITGNIYKDAPIASVSWSDL
ncbi:hypothetical protein DRW07_07885 [Alteromonas sediminis]|uniref:DNA primase/polymerase bifunctional N-terminal domain-containing protein n=1 Tax=Alteromonas sediminis TaxID=2259342 RepID=A0A3N5Y1D3_9ALTE|nr:hypothetical protein [Alteromonas sediminis]RPJ67432.1 hypothetical protein DRW07_07885 [Alteromonas sediminis]